MSSRLKEAQAETEAAVQKTNQKIEELGKYTQNLYVQLTSIQDLFDRIRNIPNDQKLAYEKLKRIRISWKEHAEQIQKEYKLKVGKTASEGAAGVGMGVAAAALGPSAAMGIATTFGVASTGTAIIDLSGVAAVNAALAWLGGGALAAGGGGMAAGEAFLMMFGPVGWTIAGVALLSSGVMLVLAHNEKKRLDDLFCLISKRDTKKYQLAIVELNERIKRIKDETGKLEEAIRKIKTFGTDYRRMTKAQQYELGAYVNLMNSSTQLLVNPIKGLQPSVTKKQIRAYADKIRRSDPYAAEMYGKHEELILSLSNLLYSISMDDTDRKLLEKSMSHNKEFLKSAKLSKKEFIEGHYIELACRVL